MQFIFVVSIALTLTSSMALPINVNEPNGGVGLKARLISAPDHTLSRSEKKFYRSKRAIVTERTDKSSRDVDSLGAFWIADAPRSDDLDKLDSEDLEDATIDPLEPFWKRNPEEHSDDSTIDALADFWKRNPKTLDDAATDPLALFWKRKTEELADSTIDPLPEFWKPDSEDLDG